ncbi:hypothetical protein EJ05DRAFT_194377 [Pseudovirgaria hyperparasitica]|uniref:Uncharacterized protein n=1 Tax=Pseudovirgaria hyperparasitica TaxID=470096 RepID=A0A6A6WIU8_9PEZI|nr:uncharacterized protein EJ05DRAFT_194377 [Pseudovirgaria hyperparasitica]KAF2762016.1 hypothetical protein EJ05DRAFT_194377 [Pseudovirgaria hyperparasitica]
MDSLVFSPSDPHPGYACHRTPLPPSPQYSSPPRFLSPPFRNENRKISALLRSFGSFHYPFFSTLYFFQGFILFCFYTLRNDFFSRFIMASSWIFQHSCSSVLYIASYMWRRHPWRGRGGGSPSLVVLYRV